jgi:hypothetical protein
MHADVAQIVEYNQEGVVSEKKLLQVKAVAKKIIPAHFGQDLANP